MSFILKWLGFTTLKALLAYAINKWILAPLFGWLARNAQHLINDPETDLDEQAVEGVRKWGLYASTKKLKSYF